MKILKVLVLLCVLPFYCFSQDTYLHIGGQPRESTAILQLDANDRAMRFPAMGYSNFITMNSPADGLLIYSNTSDSFWYYNGNAWEEMLFGTSPLISKVTDLDEDTRITTTLNEIYFFVNSDLGISLNDSQFKLQGLQDFSVALNKSGAGDKLIYNNVKKALRVGTVSGTEWDEANIGFQSIAFGVDTKASSSNTGAWGIENLANAPSSVSFGQNNISSGVNSISWGKENVATNFGSSVWGEGNLASGQYSSAWGFNTVAFGIGSTAWGKNTEANGDYATSFGTESIADGDYSTSWGNLTYAKGDYSTTWGKGTVAESFAETAIGSYNEIYTPNSTDTWDSGDRLFVVGNGPTVVNRSDAMRIYKNGEIQLFGTKYESIVDNGESTKLRLLVDDVDLKGFEFKYDGSPDLFTLAHTDNLVSNTIATWTKDGKLGVNRTPTTNILEVNGDAAKNSPGNWLANSDERLKKNIISIEQTDALNKVLSMNPVHYEWKNNQTDIQRAEGIQMGFIAQELQEIYPEKVTKDLEGFLITAYGVYDPIFVAAFQYQQKQIESLQTNLLSAEGVNKTILLKQEQSILDLKELKKMTELLSSRN